MAAARVKGTQGANYSVPHKLVASPKHLAAYGQPESGRDYNTTDMSLQRPWNFYLPPFKAAIDAGADTAMCSVRDQRGAGLRQLVPHERHPQGEVGLRRLRRERLDRRG
jgi:beta-glucosidase